MCMHRVLANRLAQRQPVDPGKHHVADDQCDIVCPHPPQRLHAVGRVDHRARRLAETAQASAEVDPPMMPFEIPSPATHGRVPARGSSSCVLRYGFKHRVHILTEQLQNAFYAVVPDHLSAECAHRSHTLKLVITGARVTSRDAIQVGPV
jgi:hypothetical protein